jgi:UDP-N-acetylglucosamine--N-acetylmuramyl-(pentapeptide) pyrophosphoryl-undecaprenol N-acetylglucosamine transferase
VERAHVRRRVAIAAGGTAGHVHPALAIADAYRDAVDDLSVVFLGTPDGLEARLVPRHGYRLAPIPAAPLFGVGIAGKLRAMTALVAGTAAARRVLHEQRSEIVVGFGGYASAGTLLAARTLGIPMVVHEANAVAGLTNRLLGRLADRVALGFASAAEGFAAAKTLVTGMPVGAAILRLGATTATRPRDHAPLHVLVCGGSGGSGFLNARVPELLARVAARGPALAVRHQVGAASPAPTAAAYARAGIPADVVPYLADMADAYDWADFAVTCAGAATLAELAAVGLPALLVPLAHAARDHQTANARAFAALTGVRWVCESDWSIAALAPEVADLLGSPPARAAAAVRMRAAARPDAARAVVAACEATVHV